MIQGSTKRGWLIRQALGIWACLIFTGPGKAQEVLYPTTEKGQPLSIEVRPILTLGTADGNPAEEFFRVTSPFMLREGEVAVPLPRFGEIRVFDSTGALAATYGRLGEGPGEFRGLIGAWSKGDTIEAFDGRLRRITRFLPNGSVQTVPIDAGGAGYRPDSAVPGVFRGGWALMGVSGGGYGYRDEITVGHFGRDGEFIDTIAQVEGIFRYKAPGMTGPTPLSPSVSFALLNDVLYIGETLKPAIDLVTTSGEPSHRIIWEQETVSPREALRRVVRLAVDRSDPEDKAKVRERLEAAPVPEEVPYFSAFQVDALGFVWVRPYTVERDAAALGGPLYLSVPPGGTWWVFSPEGKQLGEIELPPGLEPHQITVDSVVGVRRDDLGIEYVEIHRVHRR